MLGQEKCPQVEATSAPECGTLVLMPAVSQGSKCTRQRSTLCQKQFAFDSLPTAVYPGTPSRPILAMWQKRQRSRDTEAPGGKRLRENILDLYGSGDVPADRTQELLDDAGDFALEAGTSDFQDLRSSRSAGSQRNVARDLSSSNTATGPPPTRQK